MGFKLKCVPVLDKMSCYCCSCDIRIATCLLGWLDLISYVGSLLKGVIVLVMFEDSKDGLQKDSEEALIVTVVLSAVCILLTSLLLYGAHNKKPGFMLPALIFRMITLVIVGLAVVCNIIWKLFFNINARLFLPVFGEMLVVLESYLWIYSYSYYRKLEEQEHPVPEAPLDNIPV